MRSLVVSALVISSLAGAQEQRRLELLGTMSRAQQLAPANQGWLVSYVRRASSLYQHRLDGLACQDLFSLGTEQAFHGAVGCVGEERNCVFIEGAGSPKHVDQGPFIFPADTFRAYWPPEPARNTYWHEVQHALLEAAGVGVAPAPYGAAMDDRADTDDHHAFIEGVGQRGAEAYFELLGFEAAVRRADQLESEYLAQGRDPSDHAVQRQLWGEAHQRFSAFTRAMKRVANMPPQDLANYRAATGVWFSPVEDVAEWYRRGGLKRQERGEVLPVRPPGWVFFPDLLLMPVRVLLADARGQDLEGPGAMSNAPSEVKDDVFRQAFVVRLRARGSLARWKEGNQQQNRAVMGEVTRGRLRVRLVEDDELATLAIAGVSGVAVPGASSSRLFDVDVSQPGVLPLRVTLARRKLSTLTAPTTLHVVFEYADPGADRVYDASSAQLGVPLVPGAVSDPGGAAPTPTAAPPPSGPAQASAPKTPLGVRVSWSNLPAGVTAHPGSMYDQGAPSLGSDGSIELVSGPSVFFKKGVWRAEGGFFVEVYAKVFEKNLASLAEYTEHARPKQSSRAAEDWFGRFTHRETKVSGLRAFESVMTGKMQRNHHWFVELDPQRRLWATILCDVKVASRNVDAMEGLSADLEAVVRALRFSGAPAVKRALQLTRSERPVPRAFTEEPLSPNEIAQRPPPPPPDAGGKRRRRAAVTPPSVTSTAGSTGEGAVGPRGSSARPAPTAAPPTAAPPTAAAPPPPTGASARGSRPPGAPELVVKARVAAGTAVILSNQSGQRWSGCTVTIPGRRVFALPSMYPQGSEELPLRRFSVDPAAEELRGELVVRCAEGTGRAAIRL